MGGEVTSPLRDIIKRAAERQVEGPAGKLKQRFADASDVIVILADCSISMDETVGHSQMEKWEHLKIALADCLLWPGRTRMRIFSFSDREREISGIADLPRPGGGTDLTRALRAVTKLKPRKTIVITDGLPNNKESALAAAEEMTGAIDTIYCGPEGHEAIDFLQKLSRDTGGIQVTWDGYKALSSTVRGLLGPAPDAKPDPDPKKHGPWNFFSNRRPTP